MKTLILFALGVLCGCKALPDVKLGPPPPNSCAVWSRSAQSQLAESGVWARVLAIQFVEADGHQVCVFQQADGALWIYDPALSDGYGNFGNSYQIWTRQKNALQIAWDISGNREVKRADFL